MKKKKVYKFCTVEIVGDPNKWEHAYTVCDIPCKTAKAAEREGEISLGHDDFIVAEMVGGKCVAVHIGDQGRHTAKSYDFGEYVSGINEEMGVN